LVQESFSAFIADEALTRGAAISFYTVTSMAPVLLIVVAIAGIAFGEEAARGAIVAQLRDLMGQQTRLSRARPLVERHGTGKCEPNMCRPLTSALSLRVPRLSASPKPTSPWPAVRAFVDHFAQAFSAMRGRGRMLVPDQKRED
jgi:hypothetical protein